MKIVVSPDSYKGTMTAAEAAAAIAKGLEKLPETEVMQLPVADGGEGTIDAFVAAGAKRVYVDGVEDALRRRRRACYAVTADNTAIIESAEAVGLCLIAREDRDIRHSDSRGLARLLRHAAKYGCKRILVGLGGSATNDGGTGMLKALGYRFFDDRIDCSEREEWLDNVQFQVLCDVQAPFCGPNGATMVFALQKGADDATAAELEQKMVHLATTIKKTTGTDLATMPGAGAAGGLGGAFAAFLGAKLVPGIETVLDAIGFDKAIEDASLVITGEGAIDRQSLMGKATIGVLKQAQRQGIPVIAIAGRVEDRPGLLAAGFAKVIQIIPFTPSHTLNLTLTVKNVLLKNIINIAGR